MPPSPAPRPEQRPHCAVLGTLDILRDLWALGILRCVFYGINRYSAIQRELGIATNVLADRLDLLVERGILERVAYQHRPLRHEYVPTAKGATLGDVIIALRDWGAQHLELAEPLGPLRHRDCDSDGEVQAAASCTGCGRSVAWDEIVPSSPSDPQR